jgi:hypothetical protein
LASIVDAFEESDAIRTVAAAKHNSNNGWHKFADLKNHSVELIRKVFRACFDYRQI